MKKQNTLWLIGIIVVIVLIIYGVYSWQTSPGEYDDFSKCLSENGAKIYGTDWCKYCKEQKSLFGKSFKLIDYVNCDYDKDKCNLEGIQGYPTWKINGEVYSGVQPLERLSQLTGCEL